MDVPYYCHSEDRKKSREEGEEEEEGEGNVDVSKAIFESELRYVHCKKRLTIFPSSAGMSLTKLSLAENI
jgi:hypothetical protein